MHRLHQDTFLLIHLVYDRRSTSHRLVAEKYRPHCLNAQSQPVVVDDLQHIRLFHTVHCLAPLIVVHEDDLFFLYIEDTPSREQAYKFPFVIHHGEITETLLCHDLLHVVHIILHPKGDQITFCHKIFHRNTLVDMLCRCKRIKRRADDHDLLLLRLTNDLI